MIDIERDVGKLEARMENVETELQAIRTDVREIRDALVGVKGSWLILTGVVALAISLGAAVSSYIRYFQAAGS